MKRKVLAGLLSAAMVANNSVWKCWCMGSRGNGRGCI